MPKRAQPANSRSAAQPLIKPPTKPVARPAVKHAAETNGPRVAAGQNGHAGRVPRAGKPTSVVAGAKLQWDYAPAPESFKVAIAERYGHFINGRFTSPPGGPEGTFATINPATDAVLARVTSGTPHDVDGAVHAARAAFPAWAALPGAERGKHLFRLARRIAERARELAVLETLDGGKPIRESRDVDVPLAAQHFFYHAGWADKLVHLPGVREPRPIGVCAQIVPWNFPLLMAAWKIAPALACGNTVVLKPAETTPLTALRLAEIMQEVGLPAGVVNIVTGDGATGAALAAHPGVDKVAFTGSTGVGKRLAAEVARSPAATGRAKRLTLELGGKGANIVFDDAPLDQAVEGIVEAIYFNQGHVCCAGSRLLVQEGVAEQVVRKLRRRIGTLRVGDPMDKNTDVGAINSRQQLGRIEAYLRTGAQQGATLHVGGDAGPAPRSARTDASPDQAVAAATGGFARGSFCRPCFFTGVQPAHTIAREEIFGPVLAVMTFRTPQEAIERANNTPYGLSAGVWTDKGSKALQMARQLDAGVVWLNTFNKFDPASPFGGFKESGVGREGGRHGLAAYLE